MPPALVQRKASQPEAEVLYPTTTLPSLLTALAPLEKLPPPKSPNGVKLAVAAGNEDWEKATKIIAISIKLIIINNITF
jgi:hypothetical protein